MNDELDATTLILNGPSGLEIGSGLTNPDQGDGDRMWNTASLIADERRFSRLYRGRTELIDHIVVSRFLVTGTGVVTDVTTVTAAAGMPSMEDDPNARQVKPGLDHAAVVATFDF